MVYSHCFKETHGMVNQNVAELTCAQIYCWPRQRAASGVSSYRPARVEDAGNVDRRARKPPAKRNVLVAHSRGYRP